MRARDSPICIFFLLKKGMQDKKAIGLPILSTNKRTGGKAIMIRTKRILALFLAVVLMLQRAAFFCFRRRTLQWPSLRKAP